MGAKLSLGLFAVVAACSGSSPQVLTGRIGTGYPGVTAVRAMRGSTVLASAPLAADGSFRIAVPPSRDVTLQLIGSARSDVVFPRQTGTIQRGIVIRGGGQPFDLGTLHLVGAVSSTTVAFHNGTSATDCHDGKDATGATCIDDDDHEDSCEAEDGGGDDDNGAEADASTSEPDAGDSTADHNFPADGCAGDDAEGSDDHGGSGS